MILNDLNFKVTLSNLLKYFGFESSLMKEVLRDETFFIP